MNWSLNWSLTLAT